MKIINYKNYGSPWSIIKRHWQSSLPYLNIAKIFNIILAKTEEKSGAIMLRSKPFFIKIEPTSRCNLSCPGCLHASGRSELKDNNILGDMDIVLFKKIIDNLAKYLVKVSLYLVGEPLIYSRIAEMLSYLQEKKIGSVISSNLNFLTPRLAHDLVKYQLTHLIVSLDGPDQACYELYRKGGNFDQVIANIKLIQAEKKRQKSRYPIVEIQIIDFEYITKEKKNQVAKLAEYLAVDRLSFKENVTKYYDRPAPKTRRCFWLYGHPSIRWNGQVQPCCYYYEYANNIFGDAARENIMDIMNNEKYQSARHYFKTGKQGSDSLKCHDCIFFKRI